MKSKLSFAAVIIVGLCYVSTSLINFTAKKPIKVTTWDALGYYMYLPATIIYNDLAELKFYPEIEKKYSLQGIPNEFYQFGKLENGNYTGKYFVGVALMESPFFMAAHLFAKNNPCYEADGFSQPYQVGIILGALFYCLFGLFILRFCLLQFYTDKTVSITLLLLALATNLIQYSAIDVAQSHVYAFFLYCLILYFTIQWHKFYNKKYALLIGLCIGLATICRPTELIMFFIPLLWSANDRAVWKNKIDKLFRIDKQLLFTAIGFSIIILIQITYWKYSTGNFVHNVGSKWHFFNPHFRVLFGFEKGWFIYTPITIFFMLGFYFLRGTKYQAAIITFCILNIWIVISWADWRYGGSYSTRALVQSYPVFAFAIAAFIAWIQKRKIRWAFYALGFYLIFVNLFQIYQYNNEVLHYDNMNFEKYKSIYLNPNAKKT